MPRISIQEIVAELINRGTGFNYGNPNWRERRRERCRIYLTKLGRKLGFDVYPHAPRRRPQYMVDLCWFSSQANRWSIELAVEIEWDAHSRDVVYDFIKLICIKAPRKIMLCAPFPSHRSDALRQMIENVRHAKYSSNKESYAIVFFVYTKNDRELTREGIESRAYFLDSKGVVTSEMIATMERGKRKVVSTRPV